MTLSSKLAELILKASDQTCDPIMKDKVRTWSSPNATPLEILEVLDAVVNGSLAPDIVVTCLDLCFKEACLRENISIEEVTAQAHWRNE